METNRHAIASQLKKEGGPWLAAARQWMQSNVKHGDTLVWSSTTPVTIPFSALEDLACTAVAAALAEERKA